jgi:REP element-mobilizing transposase RayT
VGGANKSASPEGARHEVYMPQSLSKLYVHLIFSTKRREPLLLPSVRSPLYAYLATVLNNQDCPALKTGGTSDHAHVLFRLSKNLALADVVEKVKTSSSKWLKTQARTLQSFHWQSGYSGFSVSAAEVDAVAAYIEGQEEHHRVVSFQEEYRKFLREYGVEYDERYVWD